MVFGFVVIVYALITIPVTAVSLYLLLLTVLSGRLPPAPRGSCLTQFVIMVPAHNEERSIARTVASLQKVDYPPDRFRICVVADNCTDRTADVARGEGAQVLVRQNDVDRGKGFALAHAYDYLIAEGRCDAVVVIDADTVVSPNILRAFDGRLEHGERCAHAFYGVLNPLSSWRTRLMTIALAIHHRLRSRGRERLGVTAGLRGNGMCFTLEVLRQVPHQAFSIVEDLEYTIALARAGVRIAYVDDASVLGEMVAGGAAAETQRRRWEGGRAAMARMHGLPLLWDAIKERDRVLLDLALDVLVPPLSMISLAAGLSVILGLALAIEGGSALWILPGAFSVAVLLLHVACGVQLSKLGRVGWVSLAAAPVFILWKLALALRARGTPSAWIRTRREAEK
jgi:cellulose synthase/poly-beta-1,6-N-acetylglucosamine synthase-like glycosyltransferase